MSPRRLPRVASIGRHVLAGRDPVLLGASVVLPRFTGLVTLPVYTRLLGPEDFGRYELLTSIVALLYPICLVGMDFAISVRFFGHDEPARRRDVASALGATAVASTAIAGTLALLAGFLGPLVLESPGGGLAFAIVMASVPFNVVGGVLAMYLRLTFQGVAFFRAMLGGAVGGTAVGLALVLVAHWGLMGAVVGLTAVHATTFILLAVGARGGVDLRLADRTTALHLVKLGAPLVPAGAASWVFALADRFFVAALLGFGQLGLYASAARLATVLAFIQFGFHAAWGPIALRWGASRDRDQRYADSLLLVAVAGGATVAIVSWLAEPLLWLLAGPEYTGAKDVVWLLAAGVLFSAMFLVVQIGASLAQRGGRIAWTMIFAALVNTLANLALIPSLGYLGAGVATMVTYMAAYVVMCAMSQRVTPIAMGYARSTAWAVGWTLVAASSALTPLGFRPVAAVVVVAAAVAIGLATIARSSSRLASPAPVPASPGRADSEGGSEVTPSA